MAKSLPEILRRIQRRPLHERRILALSVYAVLATVVIAIWITSLRLSLDLAPADLKSMATKTANENDKIGIDGQESQKTLAEDAKLKTPLQTLKEAFSSVIYGAKGLGSTIYDMKKNIDLAATATSSRQISDKIISSGELTDVAALNSSKPETGRTDSVKIIASHAVSPTEAITSGMKEMQYSDHATAKLVMPPPEFTKARVVK